MSKNSEKYLVDKILQLQTELTNLNRDCLELMLLVSSKGKKTYIVKPDSEELSYIAKMLHKNKDLLSRFELD